MKTAEGLNLYADVVQMTNVLILVSVVLWGVKLTETRLSTGVGNHDLIVGFGKEIILASFSERQVLPFLLNKQQKQKSLFVNGSTSFKV